MKGFSRRKIIPIFVILIVVIASVFCGCGGNTQINKLNDLNGKLVATEKDSVHREALLESVNCDIVEKNSNGECVSQLLTDKVDGVALDYLMGKSFIKTFDGLILLEERLNVSEYGFGFNKDMGDVRQEFDAVLNQMKLGGEIDRIIEKWISDGEKSVSKQDWAGLKGTLTCQIDPDVEPICYKQGDEYFGIDIDIILTVAERLDYKIEFVENSFDDLVSAVIAKETDFIASGLTITETRKKRVDFTVGYLDASTVVLVLDRQKTSVTSGLWGSIKNGFKITFMDYDNVSALLGGLLMTVFLIVVSLVLGFVLGSLLFLFKYYCDNVVTKAITKFIYGFTLIPMSTWLLVCYYLIFPARSDNGYLVAIFGLTISFTFNVFRTWFGALESIPKGQIEASITMGYNKRMTLKKIILPQIFPTFLSSIATEMIYHIRDTSIVGYIAVNDIQLVADALSAQTAEPFFPIVLTAIVYISLCVIFSFAVKFLRKKLFPEVIDVKRLDARVKKGVKK